MKRIILLVFAFGLLSSQLIGQNKIRPISLQEDSKTITVVEYSGDLLWVREGGLEKPKGDSLDTYQLVIKNGEWFVTLDGKKSNGSMKFDGKTLLLDNVKLDGDFVSKSSAKKDKNSSNDELKGTLTVVKTDFKYNPDSLAKHQAELDPVVYKKLCDTILQTSLDYQLFIDGGKEFLSFGLVFDDKYLIEKTEEASVLTTDGLVDLDIDLFQENGVNDLIAGLDKNQTIPIYRIRVIPEDHVSSFIKEAKVEVKVDTTTVPPASLFPKPEKKGNSMLFIIIAIVVVVAAAVVLFFLKKKNDEKKREEEERKRREEEQKRREEEERKRRENENKAGDTGTGVPLSGGKRSEFDAERQKLNDEIARLKSDKERLSNDLERERSDAKEKIANAREDERHKVENEIKRLKKEKDDLTESLECEKEDAKKKVIAAREEEQKKAKAQIEKLQDEKKQVLSDLDKEKKAATERVEQTRTEERQIAERKISELNASHEALVAQLRQEQKVYTDRLAIVPFASQYAQDIYGMIDIVNEINVKAGELANSDVEDPYMIFKAIGKFNMAISKIDYEEMLLDVSLAARDEMSFTDSGITNLKTVSKDQMFASLRSYFLSAYLEKYINAAVVYNESLAGMDKLVSGLTPAQTAPFSTYRDKLKECFKRLGIAVVSVKLGDRLGDNVDLKAQMIDFDDSLPADTIIGIENCLVYPEGGRRPQEKIYVIAQK